MLNQLRNKTQELLNRNDENFKKYSIINDILKNERCFYEMDMDTSISIIMNLGYSYDDSLKIYSYFLINS
jgi:hypothetical protein